jgi:transposase
LRPAFSSTTEATVKLKKKATPELRLRVISAVDYADGSSIRERIKETAKRTFYDDTTGCEHTFTWRTISTWVYRFKKNGIISIDNKTRSDKHTHRKILVSELAEAIRETLPTMSKNKSGIFPKSAVYRKLMVSGLVTRKQLSQTSFYRMVRENDLLNVETTKKLPN